MLTPQSLTAPTPAEEASFNRFAIDIRTVAGALKYSARFAVDQRSELDLRDPRQVEFGMTALAAVAKQHAHRGGDMPGLVERLTAMLTAGRSSGSPQTRFEAGLHLLCAIAMAECLQQEAARHRRDRALRELADGSMAQLAAGFVMRFGATLPEAVTRVFPRFTQAVRRVPPWAARGSSQAG